jgi:hypothetical protein
VSTLNGCLSERLPVLEAGSGWKHSSISAREVISERTVNRSCDKTIALSHLTNHQKNDLSFDSSFVAVEEANFEAIVPSVCRTVLSTGKNCSRMIGIEKEQQYQGQIKVTMMRNRCRCSEDKAQDFRTLSASKASGQEFVVSPRLPIVKQCRSNVNPIYITPYKVRQ